MHVKANPKPGDRETASHTINFTCDNRTFWWGVYVSI